LAWTLLAATTTLLLAALLTAHTALTLLVLTLLVLTLLILIPVLRHLIHSSTTFESVSEEQRFTRSIVPHRGAA
jgi:multisubunit Na+/H+ antiporter MnhG subunit